MAKLGSSAGWHGNYVESLTANYQLTPGDSGKVFVCSGSAITLTLPAIGDVDPGYWIKMVNGDTNTHKLDGGAGLINGHQFDEDDTGASLLTSTASATSATFATDTAISDWVSVWSDGTYWHLDAITNDGLTMA
jgi:hypothetical protein